MVAPKPFTITSVNLKYFHWGYWPKSDIKVCWPWLGPKLKKMGYGQVTWFKDKIQYCIYAHRFSYALFHNLPGLNQELVLHNCDNPPCTNPHHLFTGTNLDNMRDKVNKGRQVKGDTCILTKFPVELIKAIKENAHKFNTRQELADFYGVSQRYIYDLLSGNRRPND